MNLHHICLLIVLAFATTSFQSSADNFEVSYFISQGLYTPWESNQSSESYDIAHEGGNAFSIQMSTSDERAWELYASDFQVELDLNNGQNLFFDLTTTQLGALKLSHGKSFSEYYGAGIGVTHFSPRSFDGSGKDDLSFAFFSGVRFNVTENIAFSLDGRMQFVILDSVTNIACSGGCLIQIKSDVWSHLQLQAGLTFRF